MLSNSTSCPPVSGGTASAYSKTCRIRRLAPNSVHTPRAAWKAASDAAEKSVARRTFLKDVTDPVIGVRIGFTLFLTHYRVSCARFYTASLDEESALRPDPLQNVDPWARLDQCHGVCSMEGRATNRRQLSK